MGHVVTAGIKSAMGVVGVVLLDALCGVDLGIVSWALIATPFIVTSLATAISLGLEMDNRVQTKVKETFALSPYPTSKKDSVVVTLAADEPVDYPFSTNAPIQK